MNTDRYTWPAGESCAANVYIRDTYRYTGRGKTGFEMHYDRRRCSRKATEGGYCWQHKYMAQWEVSPVVQVCPLTTD